MIFSPFLIASTLILLIPSRWLGNLKKIILAAIFIAGVGFSLLKSVPAINSGVIDAIAGFGLTLKLALDPTDLIALPFLLIAWLVWNQKHVIKPHRIFVLAVIPFSIFATMADMALAPLYIDCLLVMEDNSVVALSNSIQVPYRSYDGGMIWVEDTSIDEDTSYCRTYMSWPVAVHNDPPLSFFYINGEGLYQSSDDGLTLKLETIQPGVTTSIDYAVATAYDTLVISTGNGHFWRANARRSVASIRRKSNCVLQFRFKPLRAVRISFGVGMQRGSEAIHKFSCYHVFMASIIQRQVTQTIGYKKPKNGESIQIN